MHSQERRDRLPPVPENPAILLNAVQMATLEQIQSFGYRLKFIRRPLFQPPTIVVENSDQQKFAVLEEDGSVNLAHNLTIRA